MPSNRRLRTMLFMVAAVVLLILYYTADARQARSQEFYSKTVAKMAEKDAENAAMADRIKEAKHEARINVHKIPETVLQDEANTVEGGKKSVAGRKKMTGVAQNGMDDSKVEAKQEGTKEERMVEEALNSILKRSPIIIFSKTYCPHSKRAKSILLEKYSIVPPPFVCELDTHALGPGLQEALLKATGRRTVPNVLISGRSIGGGDEIAKLDEDGELIEKIKKMGGKRIMQASKT